MPNLNLEIAEIMHGDTEVLKIMKGNSQKWPLIIPFEDDAVKQICVSNWGGNVVAGEITFDEAAAVTTLGAYFRGNTSIVKFNELKYFTKLTALTTNNNSDTEGTFYGCTSLEEVTLPPAAIGTLRGTFRQCTSLKELDLSPITASSISLRNVLYSTAAMAIKKITIPGKSYSSTWANAFRYEENLEEFNIIGTANLSNVTAFDDCFYRAYSLTTITGTISGISKAINFSACPLTRASALVILNGLANASRTITFSASTKALLTSDDLAIATSKGWTVA